MMRAKQQAGHWNRHLLYTMRVLVAACGLMCPSASIGQEQASQVQNPSELPAVRLSSDGQYFVDAAGQRFHVWGVNYDHDDAGHLIEDYWTTDWPRVVEDFREMKSLGVNVVRIHLQFGKFMAAADKPNQASLDKLKELVSLAEQVGLYLDITGLGCYHQADIPNWFNELSEESRWQAQANFWRAIATTCKHSPAIFCYDLINEPVLPSDKPETQWLTGELGGKFFVQRIALDLRGRTREQVAGTWVKQMTESIRQVDPDHLITIGVIPWSHVFPGAKPIFYAPGPAEYLDFVSVHIYPEKEQMQKALDALDVYRIGKPLVIEEFFPLKCSPEEARQFIDQAKSDGIVSFYWGKTPQQYRQDGDLTGALVAHWLDTFQAVIQPPLRGR